MVLAQMTKEERLYRMRHSAAHIMAEAVLEMFPQANFAIGPPIENGFYYDFELPRALTPEDLPEIEQRMRRRMNSNVPFEHNEIAKADAMHVFAGQPYITGTPPPEVEALILAVMTVGFTLLARWMIHRIERAARSRGTLSIRWQ